MRKTVLSLLVAAFFMMLMGCGQQNQDSTKEKDQGNESTKIVIQNALGKTTLEEPAKKVVALEWVYAEDLLGLGVQPVGVAGIEGYNDWVNVEPSLAEGVVDVGTRQEPSLEAISKLNPDLIIAPFFRHEAIAEQLKEIAPTVMFNPYPKEGEGDQYQEMKQTFNKIAKAVGKEDKAKEVLTDLEKVYGDAQKELEQAELKNEEVVLTQAFTLKDAPTLRLFSDNSMAIKILEKIGLSNAFEAEKFQQYGYASTTVETLQNFQDAHFLYIVQDNDNIFENQLKGNPVWENLTFVKENKTYALPGNTWVFGGPLSAEAFVDQVVEVMSKK